MCESEQRQAGVQDEEDRIAAVLTPYIEAWDNGTNSGDPKFEELFNASQVASYLASKLCTMMKSS